MAFPPEIESVQDSTVSAVLVTVLDLVGSGYLYLINLFCAVNTGEIKVTIDGYSETLTVPGAVYRYIQFNIDPKISDLFVIVPLGYQGGRMWFRDGLKIEHRKLLGTTMNTKVHYGVL